MNYSSKSPNLTKYFKSIQGFNPLTVAEEHALAKKIQDGCALSLQTLVNHNLKIVVRIANKNANRGIEVEDLIQQGNIGLYEAALRFNPGPEAKSRFASFAQTRVLKNMNQLIDECGRPVRIPVNQEYQSYLAIRDGKEVDNIKPIYLDSFIGEDKKNTVGSKILSSMSNDFEGLEQREYMESISSGLSILSDRERSVINYFFGLEEDAITQLEIAKIMGTTAATVSNIKKSALDKIRKHLGVTL
jgi:RNA polymerase primary sigma factor